MEELFSEEQLQAIDKLIDQRVASLKADHEIDLKILRNRIKRLEDRAQDIEADHKPLKKILEFDNKILKADYELIRIELDEVKLYVTQLVNYLMENEKGFDKSTEREEKRETKPRKEISLSTEPPGSLAIIDVPEALATTDAVSPSYSQKSIVNDKEDNTELIQTWISYLAEDNLKNTHTWKGSLAKNNIKRTKTRKSYLAKNNISYNSLINSSKDSSRDGLRNRLCLFALTNSSANRDR